MRPFNVNGAFQLAADRDGLRRTAVRGAGVTILFQSTGFIIQMIATMTLARLLTPKDFGLLIIVTTFSQFLGNLGSYGFAEAVVQRPTMDRALATNLFWVCLSSGLVLSVGFAASGHFIARIYGNPLLMPITVAMSATIFLNSVSAIHLTLLKRAMRFAALSINDIVARIVAVAVSVILGLAGWGYWALAAGGIAMALSTFLGALTWCRWMPGLPRRGARTLSVVRFAVNVYGHFAASYFTRNLDNFLVGWFFGPQSLGFYKKAYDLCVLPIAQLSEPLHSVAVPTLSRLLGDPEKYRRYVLRILPMLAFVGMGLSACLTLVGKDVIRLLLGVQWEEAGRIFACFAPGIGALLLYGTYGWIHLSLGRADRMFRWGVTELCVLGVLFGIGTQLGPRGIALAWAVAGWILWIPALWYAGQPAGLAVGAIVRVVWRYVVAAAIAGPTAWLTMRLVPPMDIESGVIGAATQIVLVSIVFWTFYLAVVVLVHQGLRPLFDVVAVLRDMLPSKVSRARPVASRADLTNATGAEQ